MCAKAVATGRCAWQRLKQNARDNTWNLSLETQTLHCSSSCWASTPRLCRSSQAPSITFACSSHLQQMHQSLHWPPVTAAEVATSSVATGSSFRGQDEWTLMTVVGSALFNFLFMHVESSFVDFLWAWRVIKTEQRGVRRVCSLGMVRRFQERRAVQRLKASLEAWSGRLWSFPHRFKSYQELGSNKSCECCCLATTVLPQGCSFDADPVLS